MRREFVVEIQPERGAGRDLRIVAKREQVDDWASRSESVVDGLDQRDLLVEKTIRRKAELDTEAPGERIRISEEQTGTNLAVRAIARARRAGEGEFVGIRREASLRGDLAAPALEGIFAPQVHRAGRRVGVHARGRRLVHLDGLDAGDRGLLEFELPRGAAERGRRRGGHAHPIDAHRRVFRIEAANTHGAGVGIVIINDDAGHILHELTDVSARDVPEIVRRHDVLHVQRRALFHDRLGIALAFA